MACMTYDSMLGSMRSLIGSGYLRFSFHAIFFVLCAVAARHESASFLSHAGTHVRATMLPAARINRPLRLRGGVTEEYITEEQAFREMREAGVDIDNLSPDEGEEDGCGGCGNENEEDQDMEDQIHVQTLPTTRKPGILSCTPAELKEIDAQLYEHLEQR